MNQRSHDSSIQKEQENVIHTLIVVSGNVSDRPNVNSE